MANLKELRNRISSVASTQKITRAMQMVAASKLRKAQDAVESTRPYSEKRKCVVTGKLTHNKVFLAKTYWN